MKGEEAYILSDSEIKKNMNANVQSVVLKETLSNGDTVHTWTFTNGTKYDMLVKGGVDSYLGEFRDLTALIAKYPTVPATRFAILYDKIDDTHKDATGVVSIAQYDVTNSKWTNTKLNQQIPVGTNGEAIGFSGSTTARNNLLTNADWNTKEFLYLDTDLHALMCYKPTVLQFVQYDGQVIGTNPPTTTPSDGQIWIGTERVYTWDNTNKFWRIKLYDYNRKYTFTSDSMADEQLNGANIEFSKSGSAYSVIIRQRINSDNVEFAVNDVQNSALLDTNQTVPLITGMADDIIYNVSVTLKFNGVQHQYQLIKYDNTIFIISSTIVQAPSSAYMTMTTLERSLFKKNQYPMTKLIYDVDLDCMIMWDGTAFISFMGQPEKGTFPSVGTPAQVITGTSGIKYTYNNELDLWYSNFIATKDTAGLLSAADKDKLDKVVAAPKNNMTATGIPTVTDDTKKGYSAGSIWVYNSVTYTCTDATEGAAKWISSADINYVDNWSQMVILISVTGTTYVDKYFTVSNANGGPNSGDTYVAPAVISNPIVDGGTATYKVNAQGTNYSVTCQKRTITNPAITNVYNTPVAKPTTAGYYIFTVTPSDGFPSGCAINDICFFDGSSWSKFQSYSVAPAVVLVGVVTQQQTSWRKFQGTWMNTADEYIPDGNEYQTGKTYNGKAVFRQCSSGTTAYNTSGNNFSQLGTLKAPNSSCVLLTQCRIARSDGYSQEVTIVGDTQTLVGSDGRYYVWFASSSSTFVGKPYIAWIEYTKS